MHHFPAERQHAGFWSRTLASTVGRLMPKKTKKRKLRARRSKANHGKRPNAGRG